MNTNVKLLPKDIIQPLSKRSDLWGAWLTFHVWAVIIGSIALFIIFPNPLTFVFAFLMVGSRQHGMSILMHETAHGVLFKSRRVNDFVGEYLFAAPYGGSMKAYRHYHLKHHKFTQTADDPDLPLSAKFPVSKASLRRKLFRDITGLTFWRLRLAAMKGMDVEGNDAFKNSGPSLTIPINVAMFLVLAALGHWWVYFALWLAPLMTWVMVVVRVRNIAEHALTEENSDSLRHARTTHASLLARIFLAPYWVNYHVEHHAYMYVPCYRFPALHKAMREAGHKDKMIFSPSYTNVLKTVSTA